MANNRLYLKAPNGDLLYLAKSNSVGGKPGGWRLACDAEEFAAWTALHPDAGTQDGVATEYQLLDDNGPEAPDMDDRIERP